MKLSDILLKAGGAVIKNVVPGGGLVVDLVNAFLPEDKKLPNDATGEQVKTAVASLSPDQQAALLSKELDVEREEIRSWADIQASLSEADQSGSSTRPKIAEWMAQVVCFAVIVFVSIWAVAIYRNQDATIKVLSESWPLMLTVLATPTALLRAYFGLRTDEKKARYATANAQPIPPQGFLSQAIAAIRG